MYNARSLGEKIKQLAKEKNVYIRDILISCNLSINTISQMTDKKGLSSFSLAKIADYLNCSVDYLLGRTDNPNFEKASEKKVSKQSLQAVIDQLEELKNSIDN